MYNVKLRDSLQKMCCQNSWASSVRDHMTTLSTADPFPLNEILSATDDFSDAKMIGKGGFGSVYRGKINDGSLTVAIKRLASDSKQGEREFITEVETLRNLRHPNLVSLIGYCKRQGEMILVYEYIDNGDLATHLYKKNDLGSSLSWIERLKICIEVGQGLDFLHTNSSVVHRDVKPRNILLDKNYTAKVGDFGLAMHLNDNSHVTASLKGSFGYIDPEYFLTGRLTKASDTYSFGVVLLEVLSGKPAIDKNLPESQPHLTIWAGIHIQNKNYRKIVAPTLTAQIKDDCLKTYLRVVEGCLSRKPKDRLPMSEVVAQLKLALYQQETVRPTGKSTFWGVLRRRARFGFTRKASNEYDVKMLSRQETRRPTGKSKFCAVLCRRARFGLTRKASNEYDVKMLSRQETIRPTGKSKFWAVFGGLARFRFTQKASNEYDVKMLPGLALHSIKPTRKSKFSAFGSPVVPFDGTQKENNEDEVKMLGEDELRTKQSDDELEEEQNVIVEIGVPAMRLAKLQMVADDFALKSSITKGITGGAMLHGVLETGQTAAIKWHSVKLANSKFLEQVSLLSNLEHENVMKLLGYCVDDGVQVLVYEFATEGSLHDVLHGKASRALSWAKRVDIAVEAAKGLCYFHNKSLIHRNIKSSNVLLSYGIAKIADSHLSDMCPCERHNLFLDRPAKLCANHPPEYRWPGFSQKGDVYNYGVVLLELLTGRKSRITEREKGPGFVEWSMPMLNKDNVLKIVDGRLNGAYPHEAVSKMASVVALCLQHRADLRPTMETVLKYLYSIKRVTEHYLTATIHQPMKGEPDGLPSKPNKGKEKIQEEDISPPKGWPKRKTQIPVKLQDYQVG